MTKPARRVTITGWIGLDDNGQPPTSEPDTVLVTVFKCRRDARVQFPYAAKVTVSFPQAIIRLRSNGQ